MIKDIRTVSRLPVLVILTVVAVGLSSGSALGATINCSHVNAICQGTDQYDWIYGWENSNEISAKAGQDRVWGYGAYDLIWGEADGDTLYGGPTADSVYGGNGNDSFYVIGGGAGVYGNSGNDRVEGNPGLDVVQGDQGQDGLYGGDHNDVLFAEDGEADTVNGGSSAGAEPCYVDGYDAFYSCDPY